VKAIDKIKKEPYNLIYYINYSGDNPCGCSTFVGQGASPAPAEYMYPVALPKNNSRT